MIEVWLHGVVVTTGVQHSNNVFARVNSFVTKSSGTWGGADKDLAKQVRE